MDEVVALVLDQPPDSWRGVLPGVTKVVTDPAQIDPATPWVLVVDGETTCDPTTATRLIDAARTAGGGGATCDLTDSAGAVQLGGYSRERGRWQDHAGPVVLVASRHIEPGNQVRLRALDAAAGEGVGHVAEPLVHLRGTWDYRAVDPGLRSDMAAPAGFDFADDGRTRVGNPSPTISVVIPTRGSEGVVAGQAVQYALEAVRSIESSHTIAPEQYVIVLDSDSPHPVVPALTDLVGERLTVVRTDPPFNFSAKVNAGIAAATGQVVAILNDDIGIITRDALTTLALMANEGDVGAVGALLRYEDGSIQHAGQAFAVGGVHHVGARREADWPQRFSHLLVDRDVTGVTAACLVQRREVWRRVGGLDPELPVNFNDVEYCWRIRQSGLRVVQANSVELFHYESRTRPPGAQQWEVEALLDRIGTGTMDCDPLTPADAVRPDPMPWGRTRQRLSQVRGRLRQALQPAFGPVPPP